jgi:flavin-binding protein dodecin
MKNPTGNKLEKLVFGMFDQMVEGADKYVTKQGSTWLIFTESKKWVIEFTKDKTLWFNFNLFQGELDLIGKDCVEERDLIKDWFESRFLNKPKVWATFNHAIDSNQAVEDTIQNGVKEAHHVDVMKFFDKKMENTIENGVKDTYHFQTEIPNQVEDAIQEGVKHTRHWTRNHLDSLEDTIQNGVKETIVGDGNVTCYGEDAIENGVKNTRPHYASHGLSIEDTIQNGVKRTEVDEHKIISDIKDVIQNGVKETIPSGYLGSIEMKGKIVHQIESPKQNNEVEDTIQNGVKETQTRMWPPVGAVDETIENGVKYTVLADTDRLVGIEDTIENGVKETKENRLIRTISVISTINNGVKETKESMLESLEQIDHQVTNSEITENINDAIENGVKETKEISNISLMSEMFNVKAKQTIRDGVKELKELPDKSGEFRGYGDWYRTQGNMTKPHTEYVKEVIEDSYNHMGRVKGVIRNTDKDGI